MACLRSFSRRSLYSKWLCKNSSPVPLPHLIKDENKPNYSDSSLSIRRFHKQNFFEERRKLESFVQPMSSRLLLCRHMSSSSSSLKPEEDMPIKVDALGGDVVEEAMAAKVSAIDATIGSFSFPEDFVQYVINGVHELTGFNWWMSIVLTSLMVSVLMSPVFKRSFKLNTELQDLGISILKSMKVIKTTTDPKSLAKHRKWEAELMKKLKDLGVSSLSVSVVDTFVYISFINGISKMAKHIPGFENGGILWFSDLSTPDSFYILPLMTGFTFWFTSEINIAWANLVTRLMKLPLLLVIFVVLQATFGFESAVYFYVIPSRIYVSILRGKFLRSKQIVKPRSIVGRSNVPVTTTTRISEQQRIGATMTSLMRELMTEVKKKDKK